MYKFTVFTANGEFIETHSSLESARIWRSYYAVELGNPVSSIKRV